MSLWSLIQGGITLILRRPQMLAVGTLAPDFRVMAHDGSEVRLSALRGQKVVLWFFPKANTGGWTSEGNGFRALYERFVASNVCILGASFDTVAENKAFAERFGFPFLLLCDTEHVLGKAYGAGTSGFASRITYVIDEHGAITHVFSRVSPGKHAEEVLALVQ